MKMSTKKSLKFVTLLISALIIGTASAAVYNYMQINATVGVKGFDVNFYAGADTSKAGGKYKQRSPNSDFRGYGRFARPAHNIQ